LLDGERVLASFQNGNHLRKLLSATSGEGFLDVKQLPKVLQESSILQSLESVNMLKRDTKSRLSFPGYAKVQVAIRALQLGEPERPILNALTWQEFEEFVANVLTFHEFQVLHRFRFSTQRRFEIDIIAGRKPILLCIDCKQFGVRLGKASVLRKASEEQLVRTQALANHFARFQIDLGCLDWQEPLFIPMLVTMLQEDIQFHGGIPIVPAAYMNTFLLQFEKELDSLCFVRPDSGRQQRLV
jgi:Holliday junction resolvase-like predicted endonuclease